MAFGFAPTSADATRPLGVAYVPILPSEAEQEQSPGNGDREATLVEVDLCASEGEHANTNHATQ